MPTDTPSSLPAVDSIEIVDLRDVSPPDGLDYMGTASDAPRIRCVGADAERIAALWRRLPPGEQARCHIPPFGLRFFVDGKMIGEASVCWRCNNMYGQFDAEWFGFSFDAAQDASRELLAECKRALGASVDEE